MPRVARQRHTTDLFFQFSGARRIQRRRQAAAEDDAEQPRDRNADGASIDVTMNQLSETSGPNRRRPAVMVDCTSEAIGLTVSG
jgi:hypothetical protein